MDLSYKRAEAQGTWVGEQDLYGRAQLHGKDEQRERLVHAVHEGAFHPPAQTPSSGSLLLVIVSITSDFNQLRRGRARMMRWMVRGDGRHQVYLLGSLSTNQQQEHHHLRYLLYAAVGRCVCYCIYILCCSVFL